MRSRLGSGSPSTLMRSVGGDIERGRDDHRAVDGDAPGGDPGLRLAARGKPGAGDHLGDALAGLLFVLVAIAVHSCAADSRAGPLATMVSFMRSWIWRWPKPAPPASAARCRSAASSCAAARSSRAPATARSPTRDPTAHAEILAIREAAARARLRAARRLRPLCHARALRDVRRRDRVRPHPQALLRRRRSQRRRGGQWREIFCLADLPSSAGGLWRAWRKRKRRQLLKEFFKERR